MRKQSGGKPRGFADTAKPNRQAFLDRSALPRHTPSGGKPRAFCDTATCRRATSRPAFLTPPADRTAETGGPFRERVSHGQFVGGTERDHLVWCERFTGKKRTNKGNTMPTKVDVKLTFAAIAAMPRGERYTLTPAIAVLPSPVIERRIF